VSKEKVKEVKELPTPPEVMVRVPRNVATNYWYQPWSAVLAAADAGTDGVARSSPPWTPDRDFPPNRRTFVEGIEGDGLYEQALKVYTDSRQVAYLYQGEERAWGPDKTILFQQNW
jgi:hypothetical protein